MFILSFIILLVIKANNYLVIPQLVLIVVGVFAFIEVVTYVTAGGTVASIFRGRR